LEEGEEGLGKDVRQVMVPVEGYRSKYHWCFFQYQFGGGVAATFDFLKHPIV
jgi:hypothetical protein